MTITSPTDTRLIKVESSASDSVEIHSMSMEKGVMKMRMLEELNIKANIPNKLAPGGFHLMLFDLKKPLKVGESVSRIKLAKKFYQLLRVLSFQSIHKLINLVRPG